ncbi:MAG: DUF3458 domain-containing protein [Pseudomonadota bacterium]|nr:DUF3458 domain-containing protein [Pseudomonadota bacterium]
MRALRSRQFAEDAGPLAHPVRPQSYIEINNFYTSTVYEKGAELVRMLASLLGPERFRRATDLYFERHDGQAVTTDDFVSCMEDASGRDLSRFKRWYAQAGTPELQIHGDYDESTKTYRLGVRQSTPKTPGQPHKEPLHIPFAVGLMDVAGGDLPLRLEGEAEASPAPRTRLLELRETEERFCFVDVPDRPIPSLLRGFSAPVKVHYEYGDEDLMFLMAHDSDGFNRWNAAQTLAQRILLRMVREKASGVPVGFQQAFRRAWEDRGAEEALLAQILALPSESYLGDQMETVDVDGVHRAREAMKGCIANTLKDDLLALYEQNRENGPYELTPVSIGRRVLKNLCLDYLMQTGDADVLSLSQKQFDAAHNMTDVLTALRLLVDDGGAAGQRALEVFYARWATDPLVLDKWFSIQATSKRPNALEQVQGLMSHPAFSITNPNRVRSLVGAFCMGNPVRFHAADGSGYRFLSERVLELDPVNPQIASRLLQAMARWRRFDVGRQALMREQLERVVEVDGLSKDVYEVASKSLVEAR